MSKHNPGSVSEDGLLLCGYQKKLKNMKKKFFVLYRDPFSKSARLEYYDNERKFKSSKSSKRVIKLENCFNINRRLDTKYDYVIALSTRDGSFGIVLDSEREMLRWLDVLVEEQRRATISDSLKPQFEHIWQVLIQKKGLAEDKGIVGNYHVCLTSKSVTFIRICTEKTTSGDPRTTNIEVPLNTIRRCGDLQCFFYMEVGRQSTIGPGELWMETDNTLTAQHMHIMISSAMSARTESNLEPMRKRSSSATEASKPLNMIYKKTNQPDNKNYNSSQSTCTYFGRERCDSFPSRNRTSSESSNQSFTAQSMLMPRHNVLAGHRPPQYQRHSNSPPIASNVACSEEEESSISIDEPDDGASFLPYRFTARSSDGVIPEENTEELTSSDNKYNDWVDTHVPEENYISMAPVKTKDPMETPGMNTIKPVNSVNEIKCVPSSTSLKCVLKPEIDFKEYSSDNISQAFPNEIDQLCERPTRAYSIGSKMEHNKVNKRIGGYTSETEQSATRVRAFSVGSRAKIPRSDLQRTILCPKYLEEKNFNSNNNLCTSGDMNSSAQHLSINAHRDKKSTSAPILIHKNQNSADRMSDLMEIDFSKSPHNSVSHIQPPKPKAQIPKNGPGPGRDQLKKQDSSTISVSPEESVVQNFSPSLSSIKNALSSTTDNCYLEMRPICNVLPKSVPINLPNVSTISHENAPSKTKNTYTPALGSIVAENNWQQRISDAIGNVVTDNTENAVERKCIETNNSELENCVKQKSFVSPGKQNGFINNIQSSNNANTINLLTKYSQLSLATELKEPRADVSFDDNINTNKFENNSSDNLKHNKKSRNKCKKVLTENGKIIPLNDEHLIADMRIGSMGKQMAASNSENILQSNINQIRPAILDKEKLLEVVRSPCFITSSDYTLSDPKTTSTTLTDNSPVITVNTKESNHSPINIKADKSNVRPRELYYASLDLPPCSTDITVKTQKNDDEAVVTQNIANINAHNTYAKIDFDHSSDSSSSSSKNLNT